MTDGSGHDLKTDPAVFQAVLGGLKPWDMRLNDRDYKVGDLLRLKETLHTGEEMKSGAPLVFTGREVDLRVVYVIDGPLYGLKEGWCIMTTEKV